MAVFQYSTIDKYVIKAKSVSPLHIGCASGEDSSVLIHPVSRLPFIQATGIAGVLRDASVKINGKEATEELFGHSVIGSGERAEDAASRVRISDGIFNCETVRMELRPRVRINEETGTVSASIIKGSGMSGGHKFETEYISKGAEVSFTVYLFGNNGQEELEKTFGALASGQLQFGGLKSNGGGFLLPVSIFHTAFDLTAKNGRKKWAEEETLRPEEYKDITERLKNGGGDAISFEVEVSGKTESGLLVRGIAVTQYGKGAPDSMNMQDSAGDFIIPGSSLKGALKSRMTFIAKQLGCETVIDDAFGVESKKGISGKDGNLRVLDTIVGNRRANEAAAVQHRIHIDKFTAGVINGGLFSQKNAYGSLNLKVQVAKERDAEAVLGLLILALRDLSLGIMNIGSGYSIGNGFINVERITVKTTDGRKEAVIDPEKQTVKDPDGVVAACLEKLKSRR